MIIKLDAEILVDGLGAAQEWRDEGKIDLLDKGLLLRVTDPGDAGVYSMLVPADSMETYDPRGIESIGIKYDALLSFLSKSDGTVALEYYQEDGGANVLELRVGTRQYTVGTIDEQYISGTPERVPQLDHAFAAGMEWDLIKSFFDDFYKMKDTGGGVYVTVRDGVMYLWGRYDDNKLYDEVHLEDIDLIRCDYDSGYVNDDIDADPSETRRIDNFLSLDIIRSLDVQTDDVDFYFDNYAPIKVVSEHESGLKQSWIVTPRIPATDEEKTIPESVLNNRSVLD